LRLTCQVALDRVHSAGIVRDVSAQGLFIQTLADPDPNSIVELIFAESNGQPELRFQAGVARKRIAPRRLTASVPSGIGLEILPGQADYERWIFGPTHSSITEFQYNTTVDDPIPNVTIRPFRIRLTRVDSSRSQVLTIRAESELGARARALVRGGAGWRIADIQPL